MNIVYVGYPLRDSGAPHQAMAALHLTHTGIQVAFIAWGNFNYPSWLSNYPLLTYLLVHKHGALSALRFLFRLFLSIRENSPDLVYVQGAQQTPFILPLLPFLSKKIKLLYHTQDYLEPSQHKFYEWCERSLARRAQWVISNEPNRARFMMSSYRLTRTKLEVIRTSLPKWWDVPDRNEDYRCELLEKSGLQNADQPRLIVAGGCYAQDRMSPQVLDAIAALPKNYALVFTGMEEGKSQHINCEKHLSQYSLDKRVILLQTLAYADLLKLYAACDIGILLYPNSGIGHFYQCPGRLTEYLRSGLPIITSDFPGLELLTLKYDLGAVANPYDSSSIAQAVSKVGSVSDTDMSKRRQRLISLAETTLAYETQADPVFQKIFSI
jgi:glycosyltransferase involved in cell wall biosynthesis